MDPVGGRDGTIRMSPEAFRLVAEQAIAKGDVLAVSEGADAAAKRTAELIPLCHPLGLDHARSRSQPGSALPAADLAKTDGGRPAWIMEARTAVAWRLLTVYDMVKAVDSSMESEMCSS